MDEKITQMLIEEAVEARKQSFSPFSGFAVGAALMTAEGAGLPRLQYRVQRSDGQQLCGAHRVFQSGQRGRTEF